MTRLDEPAQFLEVQRGIGAADGFGQDRHPASTDETVGPGVIVVEDEGMKLDSVPTEASNRLLVDLGLHASTAERADLAAVRFDEHASTCFLWRRAASLNNLAVNRLSPRSEGGCE